MRLWLLRTAEETKAALVDLISVIVERADKERDALMPGYTHLQVKMSCIVPWHISLSNYEETLISALFLFAGLTSSFHMPSPSKLTFNASRICALESQSSLSVPAL